MSDPHRLGINAKSKTINNVAVLFALEGLGQKTNCTNRGFQFVADIRDKVGANRLELTPFGDVLDKCHRSRLPILREWNRGHQNGALRRPKEVDSG